ncbi:ABC transporter ATP-binding protein/permease [Salipaludibacillus sp. LMS25]|uniref:ABC transporter ATP-binding protein n=1 Tax=Salipaludibacillus sp. LMS25 TaxID=2924031 RepID=UPI0020D168E9|nr:ABC transporter ATP-binding protein [Salipaludibacillus sp. LMS25]UTR16547.1 ABC transporter ATP-binding protein/permease [Salipaludibacillus sp. LMS25]
MKKKKSQSLLRTLLAFGGNYKYLTLIGMFLSGVSAIVSLFPIVFIWLSVKEIFSKYPSIVVTDSLIRYSWLTLGSTIGAMIIYFFALMCTHLAAFRIAKNMRVRAISHLMTLPLGYFNKEGSGKLRRIISDSAAQTETYLAHQLPDLVGALVTPLGVVIFLFLFDWRLGIVSLMPMALATISMMFIMGKGYSEQVAQYQTELENVNNESVEYVRGIPVVKTFGQSIFSFRKFHDTIKAYQKFVVNYTVHSRMPMVFFQTFMGSMALFLSISGVWIIIGVSDPQNFLLNFLFYLFFTPICGMMMSKIMWTSQNTLLAEDALSRVNELLSEKPLPQQPESKKVIKTFDITLNNVSYRYPNARVNAVSDVSMSIKQGSKVALVGPSGGGKSTLAALIARFWDVTEGNISIGGVDVRNIDESELMKNISFVFQHTNLYKASILDNLKEGKPNATEEEVLEALKAARCEDIIAKLPKGIHTVVNTKGVYLSGGEAQRIAIARAILKDAPIILLDEATAFADPENEYQIQLAFNELTKGKTILIIAHRLPTIQNADCIYLIENGSIKEMGTHDKLLSENGLYAEMWKEYQSAFIWNEREVLA